MPTKYISCDETRQGEDFSGGPHWNGDYFRVKRVVTGTLIYEIPYPENIKDALASRGALILLESGWLGPRRELNYRSEIFVTPTIVADVVFSKIGRCNFLDIKVGDKNCFKRVGYSMVSMLSSRQAATTGRFCKIWVSWTMARVDMLEARLWYLEKGMLDSGASTKIERATEGRERGKWAKRPLLFLP